MRSPKTYVRTIAVVIASALAVGAFSQLIASPPTADAATRSACSPSGVRTLATSKAARVFRRKPDKKFGLARVYGCLYSRGVPVFLGIDDEGAESVYSFSLSGSFIGYGTYNATGSRSYFSGFEVRNLRSGRRTRYLSRHVDSDGYARVGEEDDLYDLAVTPTGSVAWIDEFRPFIPCPVEGRLGCRGELTREVRLVPAGGGPRRILPGEPGTYRVVDSGPDIAKTSLHRRGGRIYWFRNGERKSLRLP